GHVRDHRFHDLVVATRYRVHAFFHFAHHLVGDGGIGSVGEFNVHKNVVRITLREKDHLGLSHREERERNDKKTEQDDDGTVRLVQTPLKHYHVTPHHTRPNT